MASKIKVKLILELRDAHMSRNSIASTRNMSRSSVSDVFHIIVVQLSRQKSKVFIMN